MSRRLSYVLRHAPDSIGVRLDAGGWAEVDELLEALAASGLALRRDELEQVVTSNDKQRFAFDDDGRRIRASQGHSVAVALDLEPVPPPPVLFHGTSSRSLPAVLAQGLLARGRHAVHLSQDVPTARTVGARHGRPVVLRVDAGGMAAAGHAFTRSANGVWLVDTVPPEFLAVCPE